MLRVIPPIIEGETLYSYIARIHFLNDHGDCRVTLLDIFGSATVIPSTLLPTHLTSFAASVGWACGLRNPNAALRHYTHFNYFSAFATAHARSRVIEGMMGSNGGLKSVLGLQASTFESRQPLFLCDQCVADDVSLHGHAAWHRIHQSPFVTFCTLHKLPLRAVSLSGIANPRHCLIMPSASPIRLPLRLVEQPPSEAEMRFALLSNSLLASHLSFGPRGGRNLIRDALRTSGFIGPSDRLYMRNLSESVSTTFGMDFRAPKLRALLVSPSKVEQTVRRVLREDDRSLHPALYLLLLSCLSRAQPSQFLSNLVSAKPIPQRKEIRRSITEQPIGDSAVFAAQFSEHERKHDVSENRTAWQIHMTHNRTLSRTALRKLSQALWTWLYRHDRAWLNASVAGRAAPERTSTRVDWSKRDYEYVRALRRAAREIANWDGKPARITRGRLVRVSGIPLANIEKKIDNLPTTKMALNELTETSGAFVLRRIDWAVDMLRAGGAANPRPWEVIRAVGLRPATMKSSGIDVLEAIEGRLLGVIHRSA